MCLLRIDEWCAVTHFLSIYVAQASLPAKLEANNADTHFGDFVNTFLQKIKISQGAYYENVKKVPACLKVKLL